ncbi:MAG TPA: RimK/LysX family protein [Thermodesulfobacteriota bacterium]|nr:RimK/LysX family protein [Thermodesulfobacteriota bacterium]
MKGKNSNKIVIGRRDKIDLPELSLYDVDAKIDTGAYTSSIHCRNIKVIEKDGVKKIRFNLFDPTHPSKGNKRITLPVHAKRRIKNSSGQAEERYIIKTQILLFGQVFDIELSLTDRSRMEYPLLLGRKLLSNRFIVDVAEANLSYKEKLRRGKT